MNGGSLGSGEGEQMMRESENEQEIIKEVYLTDWKLPFIH